MENHSNKVSVGQLAIVAVFMILLIVWWIGRPGNNIPASNLQPAAAVLPVLATLDTFSILAQTAITSVPTSSISGDVGLNSFGANITGLTLGEVAGTVYSTDLASSSEGILPASVQADASTVFTSDIPSQPTNGSIGPGLDALVISSGVYDIGAGRLNGGILTLDGPGVYIFRASSDFISSGSINLINGARACDVFWRVETLATINGSSFVGTILAGTGVHFGANVALNGRALAVGGDVTMNSNTITGPSCPSPVVSATLHVIKLVVNANDGTATSSDFNLHVKSNTTGLDVAGSPALGVTTPGTSYTLSPGTYTVSEDVPDPLLYTQAFFGADCVPGGSVTLSAGQDKICTIINTDIPPLEAVPPPAAAVTPPPVVIGYTSGGGSGSASVPLIGILKVPNPLALITAGPVTYDYTVWNVSKQTALIDITLTDDKCKQVSLLFGDMNTDNKLDVDETWHYSCTMTLATTTTNTAIVTGYSNDNLHIATIATAIATVVVGVPGLPDTGLVAPLINIVKVPSRLFPFPFGGGDVTYTYTVTNPGVVSMNNVTVIDDKCAPVSRISGDVNINNLLDPGEAWIYTCQINIPLSTRNIATVKGSANGFTAVGYAFAIVLVNAPGLPNAGFPPGNIAWDVVLLSTILVVVSVSLVMILKRRDVV